MEALTLNLDSIVDLSDDRFFQLCQQNRSLRFERNSTGEILIMTPTGGETGSYNASINAQLWLWNQSTRLGKVFDSSTGFKLSNGATRSPDAAWIAQERWQTLQPQQRKKFVPLCPDFAIELRSSSDALSALQEKMHEYLNNGLRLGWLLDLDREFVEIYRPDSDVDVVRSPVRLNGENVLPGFILNLQLLD